MKPKRITALLILVFAAAGYSDDRADGACGADSDSLAIEAFFREYAAAACSLRASGGSTLASLGSLLLGRPFAAGTMVGSPTQREALVCRADSLDCMCALDLVLAGRRPENLAASLRRQRYRDGAVSYEDRHHFFTDWIDSGPRLRDASAEFPGALKVRKRINCRGDGGRWIPGLPCVERVLHRVPPGPSTLKELRSGDLVGFWSDADGLDVSHVGLIRIDGGEVMLLHASSDSGRVVDEALVEHPLWPRGLIVLRADE